MDLVQRGHVASQAYQAAAIAAERTAVDHITGLDADPPADVSSYAHSDLKRLFDIVVSGAILLAVAPLLGLIALLVWIEDGKSAVFAHKRVGVGGRMFRCLKFRTMAVDAEARLKEILARDPDAREYWRLYQKIPNDPRVTRIGRILRRTSLDELPQFVNVLLGDMSLVGPRPVTEGELSKYGADRSYYLAVRPGLTGPWQLSGRSRTTFSERVRLDVGYVRDAGIARDARMVLATFGVFVRDNGAF